MKVAVSGAAGRMGRLVVKNAFEKGLDIAQAFDIREVGKDAGELAGIGKIGVSIQDDITRLDADVLIDFTIAEAAIKNAEVAAEKGVKIVIGTTGFTDEQKKRLEKLSERIPMIVSPNFSLGVNVFWKIVEFAANFLSEWDTEIVELHHRHKRDAPSGTAMRLAEILKVVKKAKGEDVNIKTCREGIAPRGKEIGVFGVRGGDVVGEHTVFFFGNGERVEITHRAMSRECFASGAVEAAKWLFNVSNPGLYTMNDVLGF
nr:4-hydroxy-tetrahydrodipicolinate reductase [Archaeoglobus neptunius]